MSFADLSHELNDLMLRVHLLEVNQILGSSSVSQGRTRFVGNESILVQGSGKVEGWWVVTGTQRTTGRHEGSGTFDWTGPVFLRGDVEIPGDVDIVGMLTAKGEWEFVGNGKITGNTDITGKLDVRGVWEFIGNGKITGNAEIAGTLDVLSRLTLGPNGYIQVGPIRMDRAHASGGRIASSVAYLNLDAVTAVVSIAPGFIAKNGYFDSMRITGTMEAGTKNFRIPHPVKPDHVLRHGCLEGPTSGVVHKGTATLDANGEAVVELPDYFDALTVPGASGVQVTAVGRPFMVGADPVAEGRFTVYGDPGREVFWQVHGDRRAEHGGEFTVEEQIIGPLTRPEQRS